MASLVKTGITDGGTLTPAMITDLYDAFMGLKSYDNIAINNATLRVSHDGKVSIGTEATDHALNVQGTVSASKYIGGEFELTAGGTLSLGSSSTGSFGLVLQNNQQVATPEYFNRNQTTALEEDDFGNVQFIDSSFTASKFLLDRFFDLDENDDFQPKVQLDLSIQAELDEQFTDDS